MSNNPYSAPVDESDTMKSHPPNDSSLVDLAKVVFLAWEKLRLIYNAILVVWVLGTTALHSPDALVTRGFWTLSISGAIFANACFFAAPILETYVTWLGIHGKKIRIPLFVLGTMFAAFLGLVVTLSLHDGGLLPTPD